MRKVLNNRSRAQPIAIVFAVIVGAVLQARICGASFSCCGEERRGTVCTLAGSGAGASLDSPNPTTAAFYGPIGVAVYPPHRIVVVGGREENRLRVIYDNGSVSTLAGGGSGYVDSDNPLAAQFNSPSGACIDSEGNVLLCDEYNHRIRTILRNGSVRTLAGSGTPDYADNANPLKAQFCYPHDVASIIENGQHLIIIGGHYDHRVRVIYPNKTVSTLAGSGAVGHLNCASQDHADPLAARFCHPLGVAQDSFGNIIVAEYAAGRVRRVWRDGSHSGVTTVAGSGPIGASGGSSIDSDNSFAASIFTPVGVAIDGAGNVLVSTVSEHRVRMILANGSVRTLAGSGPSSGLDEATTGSFLDNVPLRQARFYRPYYFAIDRQGNVILADYTNNRVRVLCTTLPVATSNSVSSSVTLTATVPRANSNTYSDMHTGSALINNSASIATASTMTATQTERAAATRSPTLTATPTLRAPPAADTPALSAATLVTTSGALVAATASGGGVELQGAIVFGMLDCSNAYVRKVSDGSSRLVTVLYDQSAAWRVLGNLLVAVAALLIHCGAVVAVRLFDGSSTLGEAATKCRFPGLSHRVFVLCFQGLMLESLRGVVRHSDDTPTLVVSVVGLCICILVPALVAVQCVRAFRVVDYSPYFVALVKYPMCLRTMLLPRGWWSRREGEARRWGSLFFFTAGPSRCAMFCLLPYVRPMATSAAAVAVELSCTGRMVFLGCVHALLVVAVLDMRPHRVGLAGCGSVTMDVLLVCLVALTLAPQTDDTSRGVSWLMVAMGVASVVVSMGQAALFVFERRWVRREECESAASSALNVPLQAVGVTRGSVASHLNHPPIR